jgi:hypothetical protein
LRHRFLLQSIVAFVLLLLVAIYSGRLLQQWGGGQLDLGGREAATLTAETRTFLAGLKHNVELTFFVSQRQQMPSHLKGVEDQVRRLLAALKATAPARLDYRVIYPEQSGTASIAYAARRKASSFSVRHVRHDEHSEEKVWSSLVLANVGQRDVLIQGIEPSHLPFLEELIVAHLKAQAQAPQPTFAIAAPPYFQLLGHLLGEYGRVIELDLENQASIPLEADVLFWMQPAVVTPEHVRQLQRFVDSGRTAILAGSAYNVGYALEETETLYQARFFPDGWRDLLQPLGLRPLPDLLMDTNNGIVSLQDTAAQVRQVQAPFHLRCLPAFYNLKSFVTPARGGLNFVAASALEVDPQQLASTGFQAEIVGTTTENAWVRPLPPDIFGNADLSADFAVPKQNLMVLLKANDPWKGQLFVLASASLFQDGIINQPGYAHRVFLRTLVRTYTTPEHLVRNRVERPTPPTIPALGGGTRLFWRFAAIGLIPLLLLALGLRRYLAGGGNLAAVHGLNWLVPRLVGVLVLVATSAYLWRYGDRLYLDFTGSAINTPTALTQKAMARQNDVQATLFTSPKALVPPTLKPVATNVQNLLASGGIALRTVHPEHLSPPQRQQLQTQALQPFEVERVLNDTLTNQQVWSALQLEKGGLRTAIPHLDAQTVPHLEFLVAAALQRLEQGRAPHVAIISDLPRLSPAEALEDFHKKSLIPPGGVDVYSQCKALLRDYGYRVSYINRRDPHLPPDVDVFLWFQPRRDSSPITALLGDHLAQGGKAIVALQHFNIQQRQYRGTGFQTVYWPQPQFQDFDPYLRRFGVEQVRQVLFDQTRSHLDLETQVNRTGVREYDPQKVALPFLIRAVGSNFSTQSSITRNLGDQLFIWGNHFALDQARLDSAGIEHQVLITTTERAWTYPWKGGWLPPEIFHSQDYLPGPQALAVLLQGAFPAADSTAVISPKPGELLLIGCSEMFKNDHLQSAGFQHDQFLLNAMAYMAYGSEMAALQGRHRSSHGFAFQDTGTKTLWRIIAVGGAPLVIALYGLRRYMRRRTPLRLT